MHSPRAHAALWIPATPSRRFLARHGADLFGVCILSSWSPVTDCERGTQTPRPLAWFISFMPPKIPMMILLNLPRSVHYWWAIVQSQRSHELDPSPMGGPRWVCGYTVFYFRPPPRCRLLPRPCLYPRFQPSPPRKDSAIEILRFIARGVSGAKLESRFSEP